MHCRSLSGLEDLVTAENVGDNNLLLQLTESVAELLNRKEALRNEGNSTDDSYRPICEPCWKLRAPTSVRP